MADAGVRHFVNRHRLNTIPKRRDTPIQSEAAHIGPPQGSNNYLRALLTETIAKKEDFLNQRLYWAFFYGLTNGQEDPWVQKHPDLVERRGTVPFLNGGLFDIEDQYDYQDAGQIPNAAFDAILKHFEKYNFPRPMHATDAQKATVKPRPMPS